MFNPEIIKLLNCHFEDGYVSSKNTLLATDLKVLAARVFDDELEAYHYFVWFDPDEGFWEIEILAEKVCPLEFALKANY